jgi:hypothetical protein
MERRMAFHHTPLQYLPTSHHNTTHHLNQLGNTPIGDMRRNNSRSPTTALQKGHQDGYHSSRRQPKSTESGSVSRHNIMEIKLVRRHSIMVARSKSRLSPMAVGLKSKQDFMVGKHQ